ncbi:MAG: cysteine desulfurase [Nanoarchaeota archaeon]|nr:cysteine desulfurase [Nanoarchaeota archaeon]
MKTNEIENKSVPTIVPVEEDFPILKTLINGKKLVYLDNSATTQKPKQVIAAMTHFYEHCNANVHRGIYTLSRQATEAYEKSRQIIADFIGASFDEIIFTKGTTESLNLLASSLGKKLQPGDEIVLSEMEHHSNIVPWQQIAKEKKCILKYIPLTAEYTLDLEKAKKIINSKTKIVSVTQMSNVLGTINPITELARIAHAVDAVLIVDGAQSVPHLPVNVQELECDFLAFSGHKMGGPTGIGVLYGKRKLLENMEPFLYGGDMIREVSFDNASWNELPWKFEAGTPSIAQAIGLAAAVQYLQNYGMDKIVEHEKKLTAYALQKLSTIPGLKIIGSAHLDNRGAIFSFTLDGIHSHDVSEILDREGIAVRGGHHCAMPLMSRLQLPGTTRASLYLYNTEKDVDALVTGLKKVQKVFA